MRFTGNHDKETPGTVCICHAIKTQQYKRIKYSIISTSHLAPKNHLNERKSTKWEEFCK